MVPVRVGWGFRIRFKVWLVNGYAHRRTQDFTMRGFVWWGRARGSGGRKFTSEVQGQSPSRESGGRSPPEAEAKCEFSIQFLTFSSTKFRI